MSSTERAENLSNSSSSLMQVALVGATVGEAEGSRARAWTQRFADPANTYYRYPVARLIVRGLARTSITPNQVTAVQPFLSVLAAYWLHFGDAKHLLLGALAFEARSVLDCVDGELARAKGMTSAWGGAVARVGKVLSVGALYAGIFWHFRDNAPTPGAWSAYLSVGTVLTLAGLQGVARSLFGDYYARKYASIFETGRDETVEALRQKALAIGPGSTFLERSELLLSKLVHLVLAWRWFDLAQPASDIPAERLRARESEGATRLLGLLGSLSSADTFLTLVVVSAALDALWTGQLFFATVGVVWLVGVVVYNAWLTRRWASERA